MKPETTPTWTDYPILRMGDKPGEFAPIRKCKVLSYDGNKYCQVKVGRYVEEIKSGYIYTAPGRLGEVPHVDRGFLRAKEQQS